MPSDCELPGSPATPELDDVGKLLAHIEVLQGLGYCTWRGEPPHENLLARLKQTAAWAEEIRAARRGDSG